jgi:hypothetical protein
MTTASSEQQTNGAMATYERVPVPITARGVQIDSIDALFRFAKAVSLSGMAPKGMEKPETILVAVQMGLELGMTPMSALQNIAVINGRPGIFGDAALALVRQSGLCEWIEEKLEGKGDERVAICRSKRKGDPRPRETSFSVQDAKLAKLWGKRGRDGQDTPWTTYPERMLQFRARGFNLRDNFPDVLKGFKTTEELQDYPTAREHARIAGPEPASPEKVDPVPLWAELNEIVASRIPYKYARNYIHKYYGGKQSVEELTGEEAQEFLAILKSMKEDEKHIPARPGHEDPAPEPAL